METLICRGYLSQNLKKKIPQNENYNHSPWSHDFIMSKLVIFEAAE